MDWRTDTDRQTYMWTDRETDLQNWKANSKTQKTEVGGTTQYFNKIQNSRNSKCCERFH